MPAIVRHRAGQGVAVVVSPLIALMHDQVGALEEAGVHASFLNSTLSSDEAQRIERELRSGRLVLLYAAPERLLTARFLAMLDSLHERGLLSPFAEALPHVSVAVAPGGMVDRLLQREAARLSAQLMHRVQVSGMDTAARIVAAGLGPAILPREAVAGSAHAERLTLVPLADAWAERRFVVCWRDDAGTTAPTRRLAEHLSAAAAL